MAKTEFLEKENIPDEKPDFSEQEPKVSPKLAKLSHYFFGITKVLIGVSLLPFVYSSTISFIIGLESVDKVIQGAFWFGVASLVIIHLLIWDVGVIYAKGHKILEVLFNYIKPLVKVAPYLLPIYAIVVCIIYSILSMFVKSADLLNSFVFLLGASISLHLIFSARTLRGKKDDFLKGNYIFGYSFVYILNMVLLSFCLSIAVNKFSFIDFCGKFILTGKEVFISIVRQLFLFS